MTNEQKEHLIALYLVQETSGAKYDSIKDQEVLSRTTPYPEMAHDLLELVRLMDKQDKICDILNNLNRMCARP